MECSWLPWWMDQEANLQDSALNPCCCPCWPASFVSGWSGEHITFPIASRVTELHRDCLTFIRPNSRCHGERIQLYLSPLPLLTHTPGPHHSPLLGQCVWGVGVEGSVFGGGLPEEGRLLVGELMSRMRPSVTSILQLNCLLCSLNTPKLIYASRLLYSLFPLSEIMLLHFLQSTLGN